MSDTKKEFVEVDEQTARLLAAYQKTLLRQTRRRIQYNAIIKAALIVYAQEHLLW